MTNKRCIVTILPMSLYYSVEIQELHDGKWVQKNLLYCVHENMVGNAIATAMRGPSMFDAHDATGENVPCAGEERP